jgi:hypothetical protein
MTKTMQLVLAVAMASSPMARAQQAEVADPGATIQATAVSQPAGKPAKDDLFAGTEKFAKGAKDVSEVTLDPSMMGMIPASKNGGSDMARKMRFIVIRSYEYDKPGMYKMEDVEVYRRKLDDGSWSCSIRVRDKDGTTDICSRQTADHKGSEMVIIATEAKELTFIHMSGNMSFADLAKMGGNFK